MIGRDSSGYGATIQRKRAIRSIILIVIAVFAIASCIYLGVRFHYSHGGADRSQAMDAWKNADYETVNTLSQKRLQEDPLSDFWLVMGGFSAYQMACSQINSQDMTAYVDSSIVLLRKALLVCPKSLKPRIYYVLGKDYFQKGSQYADSSLEMLKKSEELGYTAEDLYEYLGLSFAAIHDYDSSVKAFSKALGKGSSDLLLLSIAKSYLALKQDSSAKAYIYQCLEQSKDVNIVTQAHLLLGTLLFSEGDLASAEKEFTSILVVSDANADAHFSLGEIYASSGDLVKARAEWRKAIRIDPSHALARTRLSS